MTASPDEPFLRLLEPHRGAIKLHCYRMLGSSHDGDDLLQEIFFRAWRARGTLADPARVRPWLYRIATNACLDALRARPNRPLPSDTVDAADPRRPLEQASSEVLWLEPLADASLTNVGVDPGSLYERRESVALAFVAVLQILSPSQRATFLLRDVLGFSAEETAEALAVSLSAANSALFRARSAVEDRLGRARDETLAVDERLLERYVRAFESADVEALVALLRDDVQTTMPPSPTWIDGLDANAIFYGAMFAAQSPDAFRLVLTGANGQPAFGFYRRSSPDEAHRLRAIEVLEIRGGRVARIDHFMTPAVLPLFALPDELPPR